MRNDKLDPLLAKAITKPLMVMLSGVSDSNTGALVIAMESLDGILSERRDQLHPQLCHFLENRSYQKALHFIEKTDG
ncbi:MAG: hypothetical protein JKY51_00010 [Opitutaceae bacterium]|nr:hypothetical protein [Opitutaceae bacterium]